MEEKQSPKKQVNSGFHVGVWTRIGNRLYVTPQIDTQNQMFVVSLGFKIFGKR
jgi:hypothetical protein